ETERVLVFMGDARCELTERRELLCLDQAVLRTAQILQRLRQFARAGLDTFKQSHVLDCYCRLVRKRRYQLNLLLSKWSHLRAGQNQDANRNALTQHRNGKNRAVIAQSLCLGPGVLRVSLYVGNMNHPTLKQRTP